MKIPGAPIPFHIARAYAAASASSVARPSAASTVQADMDRFDRRSPEGAQRLVAAVVPGRIDFREPEPRHDNSAIPMYPSAAGKNAAATSVSAGRLIDVKA